MVVYSSENGQQVFGKMQITTWQDENPDSKYNGIPTPTKLYPLNQSMLMTEDSYRNSTFGWQCSRGLPLKFLTVWRTVLFLSGYHHEIAEETVRGCKVKSKDTVLHPSTDRCDY